MANNVVKNAGKAENTRIYRHEWHGHHAVGLPPELDAEIVSDEELQKEIARQLHEQLHQVTPETDPAILETLEDNTTATACEVRNCVAYTIIQSTDDLGQTYRDAEEVWAMSQEGVAASGPYVQMHLEPMEDMKEEAKEGGESGYDAAFHQLVHQKSNTKMVEVMARAKLEQAGVIATSL